MVRTLACHAEDMGSIPIETATKRKVGPMAGSGLENRPNLTVEGSIPLPSANSIDIAYFAGLIDGEGSICLSKRSATHKFRYPELHISSNTKEIMDWLKATFGGMIVTKKPRPKQPNVGYIWRVQDGRAVSLLRAALPHMKEPNKIARAKLITEEYHGVRVRNGFYTETQKLDRLAFEERFFNASASPSKRRRSLG